MDKIEKHFQMNKSTLPSFDYIKHLMTNKCAINKLFTKFNQAVIKLEKIMNNQMFAMNSKTLHVNK